MKALIIKYLEGTINSNEQLNLYDWLSQGANKEEFNLIKKDWENKRLEDDIPIEHQMVWANIQTKLLHNAENKNNSRLKINRFLKYAAMLTVLLAIPAFLFLHQKDNAGSLTSYTKVSADKGQIMKVSLPDGSEVWLNYGSTIKYDDLFAKENRNIELDGEAFFKAAKNKALPMIVSCSKLKVRVLGTSFNVMSYSDNVNIQVTLEEGEVLLSDSSQSGVSEKMKPGEMATYVKSNGQIKIDPVNTNLFTSWKDGVITIYNLTLEELVLKLGNRYNQKFEVDEAAKSLRYTLTIKNETLQQALDLLKMINAVDPVQKNDTVYLKYNPERALKLTKVN